MCSGGTFQSHCRPGRFVGCPDLFTQSADLMFASNRGPVEGNSTSNSNFSHALRNSRCTRCLIQDVGTPPYDSYPRLSSCGTEDTNHALVASIPHSHGGTTRPWNTASSSHFPNIHIDYTDRALSLMIFCAHAPFGSIAILSLDASPLSPSCQRPLRSELLNKKWLSTMALAMAHTVG